MSLMFVRSRRIRQLRLSLTSLKLPDNCSLELVQKDFVRVARERSIVG